MSGYRFYYDWLSAATLMLMFGIYSYDASCRWSGLIYCNLFRLCFGVRWCCCWFRVMNSFAFGSWIFSEFKPGNTLKVRDKTEACGFVWSSLRVWNRLGRFVDWFRWLSLFLALFSKSLLSMFAGAGVDWSYKKTLRFGIGLMNLLCVPEKALSASGGLRAMVGDCHLGTWS